MEKKEAQNVKVKYEIGAGSEVSKKILSGAPKHRKHTRHTMMFNWYRNIDIAPDIKDISIIGWYLYYRKMNLWRREQSKLWQ